MFQRARSSMPALLAACTFAATSMHSTPAGNTSTAATASVIANTPADRQDRCYGYDSTGNLTEVKDADVKTDPNNCGTCGKVCGPNTPLCQAGVCRACDPRDVDCDGIWPNDNCPLVKNPRQEDGDGDGWGDVCDNCPAVSNKDQLNTDHADDGGDACDDDDDNDFCLDGQDDHPLNDASVVGHRVAANCPDSMTQVFGWDGLDPDGDGLRNCADTDDDNDNIADADDTCPVNSGTDALACEFEAVSCPVTVPWNVCRFGGCNLFLIRIVSVINPAIVIRRFTIRESGSLILLPDAGQPIESLERAVVGEARVGARSTLKPATKLRMEIWSTTVAGRPNRLISTVAAYESRAVSRGEGTGRSALLVTVANDGTSLSTRRISTPAPTRSR